MPMWYLGSHVLDWSCNRRLATKYNQEFCGVVIGHHPRMIIFRNNGPEWKHVPVGFSFATNQTSAIPWQKVHVGQTQGTDVYGLFPGREQADDKNSTASLRNKGFVWLAEIAQSMTGKNHSGQMLEINTHKCSVHHTTTAIYAPCVMFQLIAVTCVHCQVNSSSCNPCDRIHSLSGPLLSFPRLILHGCSPS